MSQNRAGTLPPPGQLIPLEIDESAVGLSNLFTLSIGRKWLMAIMGLVWCAFIVLHLIGNLLIYLGPTEYNDYSEHLTGLGPYLWIAEAVFVLALLVHLVLSIVVTLQNWAARPVKYRVDKKKGGRTIMSSTMIWTGLVVLVFVVLHLVSLKFGEVGLRDGKKDFHGAVIALFQNGGYALWYVLATWVLGLHVSHGLQSSLRTLGLNNRRIEPKLKAVSAAFGWIVAVGYSSIPIWAYLFLGA